MLVTPLLLAPLLAAVRAPAQDYPGAPPEVIGIAVANPGAAPAVASARAEAAPAGGAPLAESQLPALPFAAPPSLSAKFDAVDDDDAVTPPQTSGAVGATRLLAVTASQVRVTDKGGGILATVALCGIAGSGCPVGSFFAGLGVAHFVSTPRVAFDALAGRFIVVAAADATYPATAAILVAVSATGDPAGVWYKYTVAVGGGLYADWTTVGFNKDWIVVAANRYNTTPAFQGAQILAFKKSDLYAGTGPTRATFNLPATSGHSFQPAATYDAALATEYMLQEWDGPTAAERVSAITGPVGAESFAVSGTVTLPAAWGEQPGSGNLQAPQQGTTRKIDTGTTRMNSAVVRGGSLWGAHTVALPASGPTRAAVQWMKLDPAGLAVLQSGRVDDAAGTGCGGSACHYAYPALAVNAYDDMLIGYSRFAATQYASANYAMRFGYDAVNTLRDDAVYKAGAAPFFKSWTTSTAWGMYSAAAVDPADDTSLWILQEYAAGQQTAPNCTGVPSGTCDYLWGTWWGELRMDCAGKLNGEGCDADGHCSAGPKSCQSGQCAGASPVVCTALDQCHAPGVCAPATGVCTNPAQPNGTACTDGNACTLFDTCSGGFCVSGATVSCTALDQCHSAGVCNPATGVCSNPLVPNGTSCNDGNPCTTNDICTSGVCGGTRISAPRDVHNDLRMSKSGASNLLAGWPTVTPDPVTSHFHIYRATTPTGAFPAAWPLQTPEPPAAGYLSSTDKSWVDTAASGNTFFYDLRSANACEDLSP